MKFSVSLSSNISRMGLLAGVMLLAACTTTTIDEVRQGYTGIQTGESVVVLGRRHKSDYETEVDFIRCVGNAISDPNSGVSVVPEQVFADNLFPWFEPRTAPIRIEGLHQMLQQTDISNRIRQMGIRYIVWVDGSTQTTDSAGSIACSVGPGGAGCLGFGTWDRESNYEASIWDFNNLTSVGQISADAKGTSYMPAVVVPIPLIARVKAGACNGMGEQLKQFLGTAG